MKSIKRKGFTLVELLIVIVVIGILSAMMMLSSTEAVTSAKASNIVSNLRNMKTAALALYVDKLDTWEGETTEPDFNDLVKYLNSTNSNTSGSGSTSGSYKGYNIVSFGTGNQSERVWAVCYGAAGKVADTLDSRVAEKLAGRAKSVGLRWITNVTTSADFTGATTENSVYMVVR